MNIHLRTFFRRLFIPPWMRKNAQDDLLCTPLSLAREPLTHEKEPFVFQAPPPQVLYRLEGLSPGKWYQFVRHHRATGRSLDEAIRYARRDIDKTHLTAWMLTRDTDMENDTGSMTRMDEIRTQQLETVTAPRVAVSRPTINLRHLLIE